MNTYLHILLFGICGIVGFTIMFKVNPILKRIFLGADISKKSLIVTGIKAGLSGGLMFMAVILFAGFFDRSSVWTFQSYLCLVELSLLLGLIGTIGLLWQFFIVGKYRGFIFRKLTKKPDEEETRVNSKKDN